MREKAIVISNRGGQARVEVLRTSACDHCRGCDVGKKKNTIRVWADNPLDAKVGQTVEIELRPATMLKATFIAYAIPLISFILGVFFGLKGAGAFKIDQAEIFALFVGLASMGICFYGVYLYSKAAEKTKDYNSSIVNII